VRRDSGAQAAIASGELPGAFEALRGATEAIPHRSAGVAQRRDDVVEERWCGSGGFGDPLDREPVLVARDVRDGHVTEELARSAYGVVLGAAGELDAAATEARRAAARAERRADSEPPLCPGDGAPRGAVVADVGGVFAMLAGGRYACGRCGASLGSVEHDVIDGCRSRRRPLPAPLEVLESSCPSCDALIAADVVVPGSRPSRGFELQLG
jgi:N-methylhydantoinase B